MTIRQRVRALFLSPREVYSPAEAAGLLGWSEPDVEKALRDGELEGERLRAGYFIPWQEVASMMVARYPQSTIEQALGKDVGAVMPEIVRLAELRVRLPRYQGLMLRRLTERENVTVDEYLSRYLLDLAGVEVKWLSASIPQFPEAMRWPESQNACGRIARFRIRNNAWSVSGVS